MARRSTLLANTTFRAFVAFALIIVIAVVMYKYVVPRMREGFTTSQPVTVTFFFMPGCGHCEEVDKSGEWTTFAEAAPKNNIVAKKLDGTVKENLGDYANMVKGFPTFIIDKGNGKFMAYNGDRTSAALLAAVKKFVAQP